LFIHGQELILILKRTWRQAKVQNAKHPEILK